MNTVLWAALLLLVGLAAPVWANDTTYYVDNGLPGSDSDNGTSETTPFLTVKKCAQTAILPGDTCLIKNGIYQQLTGAAGLLVFNRSGTQGHPITWKNYPGHFPEIRFHNKANGDPVLDSGQQLTVSHVSGTTVSVSWGVIEGLKITRSNGIKIDNADNFIIRGNDLDSNRGGIFAIGLNNVLIDRNVIHHFGLFVLCSQTPSTCNQDQGLYIGGQNVTVTNNVCYDGLAYCLQLIGRAFNATQHAGTAWSGVVNFKVAHNTFAYENYRAGMVLFRETVNITSATIENNIFYENSQLTSASSQMVDFGGGCASGCIATFRNNIYFGTGLATGIQTGTCSNCTMSGNLNVAPLLVNAPATVPGTPDFSLTSTSPAINAGFVGTSRPYNGSAPDIGAFESFTCGTPATVNENVLDNTCGMNLNVPVLPASGITGMTALVSAVARTTTSSVIVVGTDSVIRTTFNGAVCAGGETWTSTYVPGNITDSALIGGTLNQKAFGHTAQAVTNNCGAAPPGDPGTPHLYWKLDENTGTNANDESANGLDGTLTNGPTWVATPHSFGVLFADQGDDTITVSYGNTENPITTSHTFCMGVLPTPGLESSTRTYFGAPLGTNQRLFLSNIAGTWSMGIQTSTAATNTQFPVSAGWAHICLVMNKDVPGGGTGTATLYVNGVPGTSASAQSVKTYTTYALSGNVSFGRGTSFGDSVSGGVTLDEVKIYRSALSAADVLELFEAFEPPSPPSGITLAQVAHQFHLLRQTSGGAVENYRAQSATVNVVAGGAVMITTQTNATVAGGTVAERLRYNVNGGAFLEVPDLIGPDGVAFYGNPAATDPDILKGTVTCCLTGALTTIDGATQIIADAVPVIEFTQDSSTVQRSILRFDAAITPGNTICFKRYTQQGEVYSAYTPTAGACVVIVATSLGSGF